MYLSWESIQANAISFAKRWEDATSEEAQAQSFTIDFLRVFGVDDPEKIGNFEYKVSLDDGHVGYINYCPTQGGVKPPPLGGGFSVSFVVCGHEQLS